MGFRQHQKRLSSRKTQRQPATALCRVPLSNAFSSRRRFRESDPEEVRQMPSCKIPTSCSNYSAAPLHRVPSVIVIRGVGRRRRFPPLFEPDLRPSVRATEIRTPESNLRRWGSLQKFVQIGQGKQIPFSGPPPGGALRKQHLVLLLMEDFPSSLRPSRFLANCLILLTILAVLFIKN